MDKQTVRRMDLHYAILQTLNWMGYAVIWGCMAVLLQYLGFSNSAIGLVSSGAMLLSLAAQPALASLVDRSQRLDSRAMSAILAAAGVVCAAVLWFVRGTHTAVMAMYVLVGLILTLLQPILNAAAMQYISRGVPLHYSTDRAAGSAAYALAILVMGRAIEHSAPTLVVPIFLVIWAALAVAAALFRYPLPPAPERSREQTPAQVLSIPALLRKYPTFTWLLVGCAFMLAAHNMYNTYCIQLVRRAGGGESMMGMALSIAAFVELPAMLLFDRLRRKLTLEWLMRLCVLSTLARTVLYLAVPNVWGLYLSSALQFFSYGLFPPVTVYYVAERMDLANQTKGQSLLHSTAGAVGCLVGMPLGGAMSDQFGTAGLLWCMLISAAAAAAVILPATRQKKK